MAATGERATTATDYLVLEQRELKDPVTDEVVVAWVEAGQASGTMRTNVALEVAGEKEGIWRPIPTRNWGEAIRTREHVEKRMKAEVVEPF